MTAAYSQGQKCALCPRGCVIAQGHRGACGTRVNDGGSLIAASYGRLTAVHLDPIEKKPLRLFMPGTYTLSVGSFGCNLSCPFCQNHTIAHGKETGEVFSPRQLVELAAERGIPSLSYTYNEPATFFEFVRDTSSLAKEAGLKNIMVTNGYINRQPMEELLDTVDAFNIDLKAFSEEKYARLGGRLKPVLDTIGLCAGRAHVEVTMLLVTGFNCDLSEIEGAARELARLGAAALHLSRYFPAYKYTEPPTDREFIRRAAEICSRHMEHVFCGNM